MLKKILGFVIGVGLFGSATQSVSAATFTVTATTDAVDASAGNGTCLTTENVCTLRAAIQEANALAGTDTITLSASTYTLSVTPAGEDLAASGDLDITSTIVVTGASAISTIIDANSFDRVFDVKSTGNLTVNSVTITRGAAITGDGGGINNDGTLSITGVIIKNSTALSHGGGINLGANSDATVTNSTINNNAANDQSGGGIAIASTGTTLRVSNSTIANNTAVTYGGGISFLEANGGADSRPYVLRNSTLSGNSAASGGPGLYADFGVLIANTIVTDGCAGGSFTSEGYNIDTANTCNFNASTDKRNTNPLLSSSGLQNNGGAITTIALQTTSPAIDTIPSTSCTTSSGSALTTDERGFTRPENGACDTGAYELDKTAPIITVTNNNTTTNTVECAGQTFTDPGATATDNADAIIGSSPTVSSSGTITTTTPANYTVTYSATDAIGNIATATRTVTVQDTTSPVITVAGSNSVQINEGEIYSDAGATAVDACGGTSSVTTTNPVNTAIPGTYTVTYSSTDVYNNTTTTTRVVTVVEAVTDPITAVEKNSDGTVTLTDEDGLTQTITPFSGKNNFRYAISTDALRFVTTNGKIVQVYVNGELVTEKRILSTKSKRILLKLASFYSTYDSVIVATSGHQAARLITLRLTNDNRLKKISKAALPTVAAHPKLRLSLKPNHHRIILKFEQQHYRFKLKKNGQLVNQTQ